MASLRERAQGHTAIAVLHEFAFWISPHAILALWASELSPRSSPGGKTNGKGYPTSCPTSPAVALESVLGSTEALPMSQHASE